MAEAADGDSASAGPAEPDAPTVADLQAALVTSRVIATAVGITMHAYCLGSDAALQHLLRLSQARNVKLSVIAGDMVDLANRRAGLALGEIAARRARPGPETSTYPGEDQLSFGPRKDAEEYPVR